MRADVVELEWNGALDDVGLSPNACRRRDVDATNLGAHVGAILFDPSDRVPRQPRPGVLLPADIVRDLNSPQHISFHRVIVAVHTPVAVLAARLRHELEHVRQSICHPAIGSLQTLILDDVLGRKAGGLDGCAGLYVNALPNEQDANAAAATFLRRRHPDAVERLCGDPDLHPLACSLVGPEPLETLPVRMVAHAWLFRDMCEHAARDANTTFAALLDQRIAGAGSFWRHLEAQPWQPVAISPQLRTTTSPP